MLKLTSLLAAAIAVSATPIAAVEQDTPVSVNGATYDGKCFYPVADNRFQLDQYLGTWYQQAATKTFFSGDCNCSTAQYSLNIPAEGNVNVYNSCKRNGAVSDIRGTATPAPAQYGSKGVFKVKFPVSPPDVCPGPNYIVQAYEGDWAVVQASRFQTLFLLSRKQQVAEADVDAWLKRAESLGANLTTVAKTLHNAANGCI